MRTTLRARLLGGFELLVDGRRVEHADFERPSGLRLLKLVLATPGHRLRREDAAERLWPEADPERSGANLRKAVHFARSAIRSGGGAEVVAAEGEQLGLAPGVDADIDVDRLLAVLALVEREPATRETLASLADLAGEELLADDPYEEWVIPLRERLRERSRTGVLRGAALARDLGDRALAFRLVDRALSLDPADEDAHRIAIELNVAAGELHAARRQLQLATHAVREAYGVEPSPELARLVSNAAATRQPKAAAAPVVPPIIGRRREIEAIEGLLDEAASGHLEAVVLRGPAGIGKTRILTELARELRASDWLLLEARGLESGSVIPFSAVGLALANAIGNEVPEHWRDPARSAALAIGAATEGISTMAFASDDALAAGVVDAIGLLARGARRTAIVIDDIQWVDAQSVAALGTALGVLRERAVLIAATMRDLESPPAHVLRLLEDVRRANGLEIAVEPLGPRETQLLVERDAGGSAKLDVGLARWLQERSAGVPLFALELFRGLRDQGGTELRDGRWTLTRSAAELVPRSVSLLVDERANRLDAGVRELLATAAEVGDEFDFDLLVSATEASADAVLDALEQGLGAGLLEEAGGRYRFAHPLFRSMLRKAISGRARPALHHRVARTMAAGVDPANRAAIDAAGAAGVNLLAVAEHAATAAELGEGTAVRLAVGFGFAAGGRQADLFDFAGAVATLRRTVGLWYRLPAESRPAFPASRALVALGWAQHGLNDRAAASEAFEGATVAATTDEERAAAWIAAAWMPYQHGRFDAADELLARGLTTVTDPVARASLEADRAWIVGRLGRWRESRARLEAVMPVLERGAGPLLLARSLDRLGVTLRDTGEPDAALPVFDRAMTLARGINDTRMEAVVGEHLAGALRELGRIDEARIAAANAIDVARLSGDRYMESVSEWIASEIDHTAGDLDSARRRRMRELEILAVIGGNPQNEAMAHAYLAHVARLQGDPQLAERESAAARGVARHSGIPRLVRRVEAAIEAREWFDAGAHTEAGAGETSA